MNKRDRERMLANAEESSEGPSAVAKLPPAAVAQRPANMVGVQQSRDTALIDLDRIFADPDQPRKEFTESALEEMRLSLLEDGQLQPVRVMWVESEGRYKLLMGERRLRGAILAGITSLHAVIHKKPLTAAEVLEIQVIENTVREPLKPIELAKVIRRFIDEFGYTQDQVAKKLKMSQPSVAHALTLLRLTPEIQAQVEEGTIPKRIAQQIAKVETPEGQAEVAAQVVAEGLTEEQTSEVVKRKKQPAKPKAGKGRGVPAKPKKVVSLVHNQAGIKIEARRGRGFELPELRDAVAGFLQRIDSELGSVA